MRENKLLLNLALICFLFSQNSFSADLTDVYKRAIKQNDDYRVVKNNSLISKEQYNQTSSSIFPEINFTASTTETTIQRYIGPGSNTDFDTETYNLTLKQPIFRLAFFDELQKSEALLSKSKTYVSLHKKMIAIKTVEMYFRLIDTQNSVRESRAKLELAKKYLSNGQKLYRDGALTRDEFREIKSNLDKEKISLDMSINDFDNAKADIYIFTGKKISDVHNLNLEIEFQNNIFISEDIIDKAISSYETITMANQDMDISQNAFESDKSQHFPTLDLVATYDYSDVTGGARFGANKRESSSVGLSLNFPLYQGGYQSAKVDESRYKYQNAQIRYEQTRKNLEKEIIDKVTKYNIQRKLILSNKEIYENENNRFVAAKEGFRSGIYTDSEVQQSKIKLLEAKNKYITALLNYLLLELSIKQYTSDIGIQEIKEINSILVW
tara:strand:- start:192 stop:1508 length:1317 start_codon:yes stop_codon:yes gene_type:complete